MMNFLTSKRGQMSEAFFTVVFLSLSGGLQDAYTYFERDRVFANAQTGNIVLLSHQIFLGQWGNCLKYLLPLFSFSLGILLSELIRAWFKDSKQVHWRQLVVLTEIFFLFLVGFLPTSLNLLATSIVSFSCAMQVQSFRKVEGYPFASTMCIGNMRSGMESFSIFLLTRKKEALKKAGCYFGVISLFFLGAGLGSITSRRYGQKAIWICCLLLFISFILMFIKEDQEEKELTH